MSIHGIHHDSMTAQAQYAEWLRRLQAETRAKLAIKAEETEEAEREAPADASDEEDSAEPEAQEESNLADDAAESETEEPAAEPPVADEGEGHLRSFA